MAKTKKSRRKQQQANEFIHLFCSPSASQYRVPILVSPLSLDAMLCSLRCNKNRVHTREAHEMANASEEKRSMDCRRAMRGRKKILRNSGNLLPLKRNHCTVYIALHCTTLFFVRYYMYCALDDNFCMLAERSFSNFLFDIYRLMHALLCSR